jgi:hypothetical protein
VWNDSYGGHSHEATYEEFVLKCPATRETIEAWLEHRQALAEGAKELAS